MDADAPLDDEEEREWAEIPELPLETHEVKYVVCLDTLGQDREFDEDCKRFVLSTVRAFQKCWEESDKRALYADRDRKMEQLAVDPAADAEMHA
jgi:hypothetical protein